MVSPLLTVLPARGTEVFANASRENPFPARPGELSAGSLEPDECLSGRIRPIRRVLSTRLYRYIHLPRQLPSIVSGRMTVQEIKFLFFPERTFPFVTPVSYTCDK